MKKIFFIALILCVFSVGCTSNSFKYPDIKCCTTRWYTNDAVPYTANVSYIYDALYKNPYLTDKDIKEVIDAVIENIIRTELMEYTFEEIKPNYNKILQNINQRILYDIKHPYLRKVNVTLVSVSIAFDLEDYSGAFNTILQ